MDLIWINISEKLLEGAKLINRLDNKSFEHTLEYVYQKNIMSPENSNLATVNLDEIDRSAFTSHEFSLLVKTLTFITNRAANFIMKPTKLQNDLRDKIKLDSTKSEIFLKSWIALTKPLLDNLGDSPVQLENVSWKLQVQLSSSGQQKEKKAIGNLGLRTTHADDPVILEMTRAEVFDLYEQLECIQAELDLLKK